LTITSKKLNKVGYLGLKKFFSSLGIRLRLLYVFGVAETELDVYLIPLRQSYDITSK